MLRLLSASLVATALVVMACAAAPLGATQPPATASGPLVAGEGGEDDGPANKPCVRTEYKTPFLEEACRSGGQKAASKAMQGFVKELKQLDVGKVTCKSCHTRLAPDFPLTDDGLTKFEDWRKQLTEKAPPDETPPAEAPPAEAPPAE